MDILSCVPGPVVQLALRLHIWCVDRRDGSDQLQDEGPTIQLIVKGETALALGEAVRGYQTIIGALMASPSSYIYLEKTL